MHFNALFRRLITRAGELLGSDHANVRPQDETELLKASTKTYIPCTSGRAEVVDEDEAQAAVPVLPFHLGSVVENIVVHIAGSYLRKFTESIVHT